MPFLLFLLFIVLPFAELALLLKLGSEIGAANTLLVIIGTGVAGAYLARSQGTSVWNRFQAKTAAGEIPGRELIDGMIVLVSGALLITPGIITDFVGFCGLLPVTRGWIRKLLQSAFRATRAGGATSFFFSVTSRRPPHAGTSGGRGPRDEHGTRDEKDITEIVEKRRTETTSASDNA